ncbi:MAG TPA: SDR family oxidoreductase [Burkholderiales bacterium]|nr:SDR family oxidoreductase [Burkholderiales bacterium]
MMDRKIAVVTGANRGIGFEICRQLARKEITVVLTSRDEVKGRMAVAQLRSEGLEAEFHQLEVTDGPGIRRLTHYLERKYGAADILVNNAGIMIDPKGSNLLDAELKVVRQTLEINVYGPLLLCQALIPLMRRKNYGRIVNLSSGLGQLSEMGAGTPAYRLSKVALNAVTRMLAAELKGTNILVNSMCPGWVRTEMGGSKAPREAEQGADTAVWLATLPHGSASGGFYRDRKTIPW